ncbi:MAG: flagellar assembly factor FliW [Gemmatimonadota bacterium]|nr:MAG: flagellar assembly factor FliW [Gemmatimonadota bacterium]
MKTQTIRIDHPLAAGREVTSEEVWEFPEGLIGLPDYRAFALIELDQAPPFRLLVSIDDPSFGLVVVEPTALVPDYELAMEAGELGALGIGPDAALDVFVPVVLPAGEDPLSLNLKGPLLLARETRRGVQRVSRDERHLIRFTPCSS